MMRHCSPCVWPTFRPARPHKRPKHDHRHSHAPRLHPLRHGRAAPGVRRAQVRDHGPPVDPSGHGRRHHRLGRGLRPHDHSGDQGCARVLCCAVVHRKGPDRHRQAAPRGRAALPPVRRQRSHRLRTLRRRHRALGHRRQAGGFAAEPAPRRRAAHRRRSHEYARSGRRPGSNISSCTSIPSLR